MGCGSSESPISRFARCFPLYLLKTKKPDRASGQVCLLRPGVNRNERTTVLEKRLLASWLPGASRVSSHYCTALHFSPQEKKVTTQEWIFSHEERGYCENWRFEVWKNAILAEKRGKGGQKQRFSQNSFLGLNSREG